MLDCQIALLTYQAGIYFATGESPTRIGNQHPTIAPYETYSCKDGYVNVACGNDSLFRSFCKAVGKDWSEDERFKTNAERVKNRVALSELMQPLLKERTVDEWIDLLRRSGIPGGPIQSVAEACESPQVKARDMVVELQHAKAGPIRVTGNPIKLSDTPATIKSPPPVLGEHTDAILADWLKLSSAEIADLRQAGAF
jgi:crotonobetainyl-CoA:carnitine CoA-transferase CaiB-like acyl-CoA transferase